MGKNENNFGASLREQREARGWPQQRLANVAGVSIGLVQKAESGAHISEQSQMMLLAALDKPVTMSATANRERGTNYRWSEEDMQRLAALERSCAEMNAVLGKIAKQLNIKQKKSSKKGGGR